MSLLDRFFSNESPDDSAQTDGIRLVVGLGNPGPEYDKTRHNIGFDLVDRLAAESGKKWVRDRKFRSKISDPPTFPLLAKPLTYMNLSGNAVARIGRKHGLDPSQILVVYDDVALPVGRLRFRAGGSSGGHNGIKSIIEYLGTDEFPRLKIGIGSADPDDGMVDHVLGKFSDSEWEEMEKILAIATDAVNCALSAGLNSAMNEFNGRT